MDKTYPTGSFGGRRVTIWMKIHERMLEAQRRLQTDRVQMTCAQDEEILQKVA